MSETPQWVLVYRKIKVMTNEELIDFVKSNARVLSNMPVGWEHDPHRHHLNILAAVNLLYLTDEEWKQRQEDLNNVVK
jgi:hypothetical protein